MQFNLGDVVMLKSGGPNMTVSMVTDDGYITCVWYAHWHNPPLAYDFEPEMLEHADTEDGFYEDEDEDAMTILARLQGYDRGH